MKTEIICILDRSGSMITVIDDAIGGFNAFLEGQKKAEGEANISIVLFDDKYEPLVEGVVVQDTEPLNDKVFFPRGMTALYDAVGKAINSTGERLNKLEESERPDKVLVVIVTDGKENNSKEFNGTQIKDMIEHQKDKYKWDFLFLSSDENAMFDARNNLGFSKGNTISFAANGTGSRKSYDTLTMSAVKYRSSSDVDRENIIEDS